MRLHGGMIERRALLERLYGRLAAALGPTGWWPAETPFEACVGAILTQNAPWRGVERSISALRNAGLLDVDALACADPAAISTLIRPTIYHNRKARRLGDFCRFLRERHDGDILAMRPLPPGTARDELLALPGIGRETADSILCYVLRMPVFVVDAYTSRIFGRHGLVEPGWDYDELRGWFESALPPDPVWYGEFHAQICLAGASWCRRNTPECDACPVRDVLGEAA